MRPTPSLARRFPASWLLAASLPLFASGLASGAAALPPAGAQGGPGVPPLLVPAEPDAAALAWDAGEREANPAILRSRFVRVAVEDLRELAAAGGAAAASFTVDLFGQEAVWDVREIVPSLRHVILRGSLRAGGNATLALGETGVVAGAIHAASATFALHHAASGDLHVLQELDFTDHKKLHQPCGTDHTHVVDAPATVLPQAGSSHSVVDVMVFYTPAARAGAGGTASMEGQIALRIDVATQTNRDSRVDIEFRLVYMAETNYVEVGSSTDLGRFRGVNNGHMDEVHGLRNLYGGDLMALITNQASFCGVAYLMRTVSTGFRTSAFSVTVRGCLGGHTLTHEMGHNIGCHHDRANGGSGGAYPYSYGWRTPDNRFRTVMAYAPGSRVPVWSSPTVIHQGYAMGTPNDDNARSNNNVRAVVAQFYPTRKYHWQLLPGGIPGFLGVPRIAGTGTSTAAEPVTVQISLHRPFVPGALILGATDLQLPFLGGTLVPSPDVPLAISGGVEPIVLDAGALRTLPSSTQLFLQAFFLDAAAVQGVSGTHGLTVTVP